MPINFLQELGLAQDPNAPLPAPLIDSNGGMMGMGAPVNPMMQQMPAQQAEAPRQRRSFLDTIGRISDVLARVGGAEAMYQPSLDSQQERQRQIDIDAMKRQQAEMGMANDQRSKLGQALGAIAENPDAVGAWPQIAQEAGIDPQRAQAIGTILQNNPQAARVFAQSLGWQPQKEGSRAKEMQVYNLLKETEPELADQYLQSIADPRGMSDYQAQQIQVALARIASGDKIARERGATQVRVAEMRGKGAGSKGGAKTEAANAAASRIVSRLKTIRESVSTLGAEGALVVPGQTGANIIRRTRSSAPGQLVEGFLGTSQQEQRDRIKQEADAIVAEMKEALKLTGTMMDRPQEYQRYVNIINNPNTTQANMELALRQLENQFSADMSRGPTTGRKPPPPRNRPQGNKPSGVKFLGFE